MLIGHHHNAWSNRGVALISVLIVVAVVSATAAWLMRSQHVAIERTSQIISQEQGILHALSIEFFILSLLQRDANSADYYTTRHPRVRRDKDDPYVPIDKNDELWSREWTIDRRNFKEFDNISVFKDISWSVCMHDVSGLVDVNMIHRGLREPSSSRNQYPRKKFNQHFFRNLFEHANLGPKDDPDTPTAEELLDLLLDWFDSDEDARPYGAESADYLLKEPPYLPSEQRMIWPEEIYLVHKFDPPTVADFIDEIAVLPYTISGKNLTHKININTAPYNVLRALPGFDKESDPEGELVRQVMEYRRNYRKPPFASVKKLCSGDFDYAFLSSTGRCEKDDEQNKDIFWGKKHYTQFLGVKSEFVQVAVRAKAGAFNIEMQSLVLKQGKPKVLQRRFGNGYYKQCVEAKKGIIKGRL